VPPAPTVGVVAVVALLGAGVYYVKMKAKKPPASAGGGQAQAGVTLSVPTESSSEASANPRLTTSQIEIHVGYHLGLEKDVELKDLEQAGGAPATKGPAATSTATTYSVELTKTPIGLGLSLTDDVVTDIKPDSQAARDGKIKVGDRVVTVNGEAPTAAKPSSAILQATSAGTIVKLEFTSEPRAISAMTTDEKAAAAAAKQAAAAAAAVAKQAAAAKATEEKAAAAAAKQAAATKAAEEKAAAAAAKQAAMAKAVEEKAAAAAAKQAAVAKAAEEKAAAAAAKKAATMEEAKKKASAEQAAVDELSTGKQVATWLTERCEINASDAKLYADAFAQLGIDKPEDLQMVDGDEVPWPSVIKPVHRKKIQAALP
jgi:hypothetical protein